MEALSLIDMPVLKTIDTGTLEWSSLPGAKQQGLSKEKAMKAFKQGISNELIHESGIQTKQGKLQIN